MSAALNEILMDARPYGGRRWSMGSTPDPENGVLPFFLYFLTPGLAERDTGSQTYPSDAAAESALDHLIALYHEIATRINLPVLAEVLYPGTPVERMEFHEAKQFLKVVRAIMTPPGFVPVPQRRRHEPRPA